MITEDYVSFEVAKLLKEKGFDEQCRAFYKCWPVNPVLYKCDNTQVFDYCTNSSLSAYNYIGEEMNIAAPTHQMAMKWLREKHIIIVVQPEYFNGGAECSYWGVDIWADDNYEKLQGDFPSYEEAVEAALKYSLENLI